MPSVEQLEHLTMCFTRMCILKEEMKVSEENNWPQEKSIVSASPVAVRIIS